MDFPLKFIPCLKATLTPNSKLIITYLSNFGLECLVPIWYQNLNSLPFAHFLTDIFVIISMTFQLCLSGNAKDSCVQDFHVLLITATLGSRFQMLKFLKCCSLDHNIKLQWNHNVRANPDFKVKSAWDNQGDTKIEIMVYMQIELHFKMPASTHTGTLRFQAAKQDKT